MIDVLSRTLVVSTVTKFYGFIHTRQKVFQESEQQAQPGLNEFVCCQCFSFWLREHFPWKWMEILQWFSAQKWSSSKRCPLKANITRIDGMKCATLHTEGICWCNGFWKWMPFTVTDNVLYWEFLLWLLNQSNIRLYIDIEASEVIYLFRFRNDSFFVSVPNKGRAFMTVLNDLEVKLILLKRWLLVISELKTKDWDDELKEIPPLISNKRVCHYSCSVF